VSDGTAIRARIDSETVRGLQLINGGMAAGLITLLPTILRDPNYRELGTWMIVAVFFGAVGLVASVIHNRLRRKCSLEYAKKPENRDRSYELRILVACQSAPGEARVCTKSVIFMWASLLFFFLGAASVGTGFWRTRAVHAEPTTACWVLEQLGSQTVKLNTCTGSVESLPAPLNQSLPVKAPAGSTAAPEGKPAKQ
jgi:hypothetical protein